MVASCTNWDLKFKEKPLILFSLCSGSKYSCLSQDRIGITAVGDKEVKGTNSVKDQWKLLTQEGPAAEISWITQLNKLSGKSIWISSSWAVSDMWASHSHGLAGGSWTFQSPSALPEDGAEAEALGTQRCCWGWDCWGVRVWYGSRASSSVLLSPCSGNTEAVTQGPLQGALQAGSSRGGSGQPRELAVQKWERKS